MTHTAQEQMRQTMRRQDELREDTLKRLSQEKLLEANMASEDRVEDKRFIRRLQTEQKEREMEEAILKVCKFQCKVIEANMWLYITPSF